MKLHTLIDISNEDYHAGEGVSSTQLVDFVENPRLYYEKYIAKTIAREETPALRWGSVMDTILLEPEKASDLVVVVPGEVLSADGSRKGKKYTDWLANQGGKIPLKASDWDDVQAQVAAVWNCPPAVDWLVASQRQKSLYWIDQQQDGDHKLLCKCRYDGIVGGRGFFDLKTTCEPLHKFRYSVTKYKYLLRLGWYALGYAFSYNEWPKDMAWMVLSKERPYECMVLQPPVGFEAWFMKTIDKVLAELHARTREKHWSNDQYQQPIQMDFNLQDHKGY